MSIECAAQEFNVVPEVIHSRAQFNDAGMRSAPTEARELQPMQMKGDRDAPLPANMFIRMYWIVLVTFINTAKQFVVSLFNAGPINAVETCKVATSGIPSSKVSYRLRICCGLSTQSFSSSFGLGSLMPASVMANMQSASGKQGES